ncbi:hypothetical protein ACGFOU_31730 [Streptomyces sp. NPDC048595]|uniref:hypothetical protein n=1 Tax=Streptomyces sp. NPDC048595 TaxID=3365576 RepID=UPI00371F8FF3
MNLPKTGNHPSAPARWMRRSAVVAGATLIAGSLVGGQLPAAAADGDGGFYKSEEDVVNLLSQTAPLNAKEAVKGYPQGQDTKEVKLEEVQKVYSPEDAIKDAKEKLGSGFDFTPGVQVVDNPDVRKSSQDNVEPWTGLTAEQGCTMPNEKKGGDSPPCGFVGVLEKKYPTIQSTAEVTGKAKLTYKTQATVGQDKAETKGWSVGGKVSASLVPPGDKGGVSPGGEVNFTYSESTTTTNKWTSMAEQGVEIDVPEGSVGWLDGRANGGTYIGYIIAKEHLASGGTEKQKLVAIPARVTVQAPGKSTPMTWVKRDSKQ